MISPIIDFHAHVFPEDMAEKIVSELHERAGIEYFNNGTVKGLLESMENAHVNISVVSRITTKSDQIKPINDWLLSISREDIIPMATWHPDLRVYPGTVTELKMKGFKCIKLHPDYQGFFIDDEKMFPFYEDAQGAGVPILFHAGLDRGLPPPVRALPERLIRVHETFPDLKIIAAHMGGEDNYEATENYVLGKPIYLDTSFVLRKMPVNILERFIKGHSADRIIYGSDSPWNDQKGDIEYLSSLPFLSSEEKRSILYKNAAELLGLD